MIDMIVVGDNIFIAGAYHLLYSHDGGLTWGNHEVKSWNHPGKLAMTGDTVYLHSGNLYRSIDLGENLEVMLVEEAMPIVSQPACFKGQLFLSTYEKGIFRWDENEGALIEFNEGLGKSSVYAMSAGTDKVWVSCGSGVLPYNTVSETWGPRIDLPIPSWAWPVPFWYYDFIDASDDGRVLVGNSQVIFLSKDDGLTWDTISLYHLGLYFDTAEFLYDHLVGFDHNDVYISQDDGLTWGLDFDVFPLSGRVTRFGDDSFIVDYESVYAYDSCCTDWIAVDFGLDVEKLYSTQEFLYAISTDDEGEQKLLVTHNKVDWVDVSAGLPEVLYNQRAYFFQDAGNSYVIWDYDGLFVRPDGQQDWTLLNDDLSGNSFVTHNDFVYLGSRGVYRTEIEDPVVTSVHGGPSDLSRARVYPNPSHNAFTIELSRELNGNGVLQIYRTNGQLVVSRQVDDLAKPVMVGTTDLPNGVYLLTIGTETDFEVGKIIVRR